MKKQLITICAGLVGTLGTMTNSYATDLMTVYRQAAQSDPTYQQAAAQYRSDVENTPIARSALLPQIGLSATGTTGKEKQTGNSVSNTDNRTTRDYDLGLTATQTLLDFTQFSTLNQAKYVVKASAATYEAAKQQLIVNVAKAYFDILQSEEDLRYADAQVSAFKQSLDQAQQQYKVGLNTITDVNLAQASYDSGIATRIAAENTLADNRENLRAITGHLYMNVDNLKENFPLVAPAPANVDKWVQAGLQNNWSLISANYTAQAAKKGIAIQRAGHYPTVDLTAGYSHDSSYTSGTGTVKTREPSVGLDFELPIFQGGLVTSSTRQAIGLYEVADQQRIQTYRATENNTRQNYLGVISLISQIKADKQSIKYNQSALEGVIAGFKVGTHTMIDILNAQENLFDAQTQYAEDRFSLVLNSLELKQAAGNLSEKDLEAINSWLTTQQS